MGRTGCIAVNSNSRSGLINDLTEEEQDNFKGHCLLFTTGEWRERDGQFVVDWASQAYCNFTIFVGVVMFVISATQIYRISLFLYKGKDSSFFSAFVDVIS